MLMCTRANVYSSTRVRVYTWLISDWAHFQLCSFLIGLNSNCIPSQRFAQLEMNSGKTTPGCPHWRQLRNKPCVHLCACACVRLYECARVRARSPNSRPPVRASARARAYARQAPARTWGRTLSRLCLCARVHVLVRVSVCVRTHMRTRTCARTFTHGCGVCMISRASSCSLLFRIRIRLTVTQLSVLPVSLLQSALLAAVADLGAHTAWPIPLPRLRGGKVLLTEILLPRIARQGTLCLINFSKRISSKDSN